MSPADPPPDTSETLNALASAHHTPSPFPPSHALCLKCNYSLRNLTSSNCPECGHTFDPKNPQTMHLGRPIPSYARPLLAPTGGPTFVLIISLCLFTLYLSADPGIFVYFANLICPLFLVFLVLIIFFLRQAFRFTAISQFRCALQKSPTESRRWLLLSSIVLITGICLFTALPLRVAFHLSRPAFDRLAIETAHQHFPPRYSTPPNLRRVGFFTIDLAGVYRTENAIVFPLKDASPAGGGAFVYSPQSPPEGLYNPTGQSIQLHPHWYTHSED